MILFLLSNFSVHVLRLRFLLSGLPARHGFIVAQCSRLHPTHNRTPLLHHSSKNIMCERVTCLDRFPPTAATPTAVTYATEMDGETLLPHMIAVMDGNT